MMHLGLVTLCDLVVMQRCSLVGCSPGLYTCQSGLWHKPHSVFISTTSDPQNGCIRFYILLVLVVTVLREPPGYVASAIGVDSIISNDVTRGCQPPAPHCHVVT
jgi:hypothetical protein